MEGLAAFGLVEVVTKLAAHVRLLRALRADFRAGRYDLVILIDYPGFHVRVAEAARQAGAKVLYYIAPQLWAWRPGRARRFASAVDRLAVVLPLNSGSSGDSASGATTSATRSWTASRGPRARRREPDSVFRRRAGCWGCFRQPTSGDRPVVAAVPRCGHPAAGAEAL